MKEPKDIEEARSAAETYMNLKEEATHGPFVMSDLKRRHRHHVHM
jgi:hypothetical protein